MSTIASSPTSIETPSSNSMLPLPTDLLVLVAGMVGMFSFTVWDLMFNGDAALWAKGEFSHGPIMLALATYLLVIRWREFDGPLNVNAADRVYAWALIVLASGMFIVGRALSIIYSEVTAFIPMLMGVILLTGGRHLLYALKFPVFFYIFMVPMPGFITDPFSHFIKMKVTVVVAELLWDAGYPISHTGVILSIGPYQLLVADACAGMRTLFMLEAMGIFYLNVIKYSSWLRNVALACLILPISFSANVIRVIVLALLTYHFGDDVGQGFLHGFAGIVLFAAAMLLTMGLDAMLRSASKMLSQKKPS
ncbi:MAG: archaeosortase/exosortase family protein [Aquabacterium sp.]